MIYIYTLIFLSVTFSAFSQTLEQREVIKSSMNIQAVQKSEENSMLIKESQEQRINDFLKSHPNEKRSFNKNGKACLLYDVLEDGTPIYITTKDYNQVIHTKAITLYKDGSFGTDITGSNMVVGVWDGGQVNQNHESISEKVSMQANQQLSEEGGNAHMTAVTGIIVGKNINSAVGIAYGASTMNYDWDKDLEEMEQFANDGYLISNHSYGYLNDTNTPKWMFGAYNIQSKAWDVLLKSKPFYLPFIAVGNEQTTSGNLSAGGYDIITGSSASKNVMTIGAVNLDKSMSNYSNWGPTDDGRIKPDIVTLGTGINCPLFENDTSYTGNVESSFGTSYASPAAAAGAILLQQYYYSLNNDYMKAAMLKALLLHSADDDASGNGPDSKFGWGILNLENAANIIKQNSLNNGTALMLMIESNPKNDGTDEITYDLVYGNNGASASLCWVDDEGSEQVDTDGIDNTTSRMTYNFSMKLEQLTPSLVAFPYNNLSISNPSVAAVPGNDWFQSGNNYLQANLYTVTENAPGRLKIRKSTSSPEATRELALIITGIKSVKSDVSDIENDDKIVFYNKTSHEIKLISNNLENFGNYEIYSVDGKLIDKGSSKSNTIEFYQNNQNVYILKYIINQKSYTFKFIN